MDPILFLKALVLGVVEGLTEFLPISSTGHLILVGDLLGFNDEKAKIFEIVIQTGAMLAVIWEYRAKFLRVLSGLTRDPAAQRFVANLAVAFMPAATLGLLFGSYIKAALFKPVPVAIAFIVGSPDVVTIPTLLYSALGQDFVRPNAAVLSLILVVPNVLLMLILERLLKSANPSLASGKG